MTNKVKYTLQEYADNPYVFSDTPKWLYDNVNNGNIKAEFRSEDYWYMRVKSSNGIEFLAGPDDCVCYDENIGVYVECI